MKRNRRKSKKNINKKIWMIGGMIAGALILIYFCAAAYFISHFFVNTTINGIVFSGKSAADVEEYLGDQVTEYELTVTAQDGTADVITGDEISLAYISDSQIEDALDQQNPLLWFFAFFSENDTDITIEVEYDEAALDERIQSLPAVTAEQEAPVDAHPEYDGDSFVVAAEEYGSTVDTDMLKEKISLYISELNPSLDMTEEECYVMPVYTSESPEVQAACDEMNVCLESSITYTMDEDVVIDKELISGWLSYDDEMNVTLDEDAIGEWMSEFCSLYDTVGTTRTITSPTGESTEVSGGTYGWTIDAETETEELISSIKNGETVEKEPAYSLTAASHDAQDWGDTYIEVDISEQYMWYVVDGEVALESDVVTGLPDGDRDTPTGVYYILYKEEDTTLTGETDPDTGEPSYETPVSFWMPFTWQGHGFHDATWQSSFGGDRYLTNGSHGCVNMPYDQAEQLYSLISSGTPVIIHD